MRTRSLSSPTSKTFPAARRAPRIAHAAAAAAAALLLCAAPARAAEPLTIVDFAREPDTEVGDAMGAWLKKQKGRWEVKLGAPDYFFIQDGSLHLVARPGPSSSSILIWKLLKREDKVIVRLTPGGTRIRPAELRHVEVTMAPLRLPGKGADVTDSARNDACFYLLLGFDGPKHFFEGQRVPDTVAYVWADGAWKVSGEVGRERKYGSFMRYIALGRGADRPGELRTLSRDIDADFRLAFPERAAAGVPDVIEVGVMVDSNTVKSEAESLLRSIRFRP